MREWIHNIFIGIIIIFVNGCVVMPGCMDVKGKVENIPDNTASFILVPSSSILI